LLETDVDLHAIMQARNFLTNKSLVSSH
jgi:hypothetical protein